MVARADWSRARTLYLQTLRSQEAHDRNNRGMLYPAMSKFSAQSLYACQLALSIFLAHHHHHPIVITMPPNQVPSSSASLSQQDYNPPRKVKRLRELALKEPSQSSTEFHLSMLTSIPDEQARQDSPPTATAPRRRGRKPSGPLSKSAREQLRKTNHSVIEKRRREKINEALAALRHLVPNEKTPDKKDKEDKEFKLEILVRTVDYLRTMVDKMKNLEQGLCRECRSELLPLTKPSTSSSFQDDTCPVSAGNEQERGLERKRKVQEVEDDIVDDPASDLDDESIELYGRTNVSSQMDENGITGTGSTRLPSISSWLSGSPTSSPVLQLPSPPQSVPFAPTAMVKGSLPGLTLPPPFGLTSSITSHSCHSSSDSVIHSSSVPPSTQCSPNILPSQVHGYAISRILNPASVTSSPVLLPSPISPYQTRYNIPRSTSPLSLNSNQSSSHESSIRKWSGDEQTAASLLLNMSSRRYSSSSASDDNASASVAHVRHQHAMQAQTPSSLLGMPSGTSGV